jgi:hypothetical protein
MEQQKERERQTEKERREREMQGVQYEGPPVTMKKQPACYVC